MERFISPNHPTYNRNMLNTPYRFEHQNSYVSWNMERKYRKLMKTDDAIVLAAQCDGIFNEVNLLKIIADYYIEDPIHIVPKLLKDLHIIFEDNIILNEIYIFKHTKTSETYTITLRFNTNQYSQMTTRKLVKNWMKLLRGNNFY
jgi:hypothetical protein